jgi:protein arginine kinase activator
MLCDDCRKNEASIHIRKMMGEQVENVNLCSDCARARGLDQDVEKDLAKLVFSMTSNLVGKKHEAHDETAPRTSELKDDSITCPRCGTTLELFSKTGRFGCKECYTAFAEVLPPIIESVQRGEQHCGRHPATEAVTDYATPRRAGTDYERLRLLREELARAVATESYERAAQLRDEIKHVENDEPAE